MGEVGEGWRVALATLAFERGVALLGHQLSFAVSSTAIVVAARDHGRSCDPVLRQRLAQAHIELTIMRYNTLRSLSGIDGPVAPPEASIAKLYWGTWHRASASSRSTSSDRPPRSLDGEALAENEGYALDDFQRAFLFSRSETIYGGSNEIQRNIIGERVLGLPPEPKGAR